MPTTTTNNSSFSTAAASGGVAGAVAVIFCWLISLTHVVVPAEVAASFMVVAGPLLHYIAIRIGAEDPKEVITVSPPPTTVPAI